MIIIDVKRSIGNVPLYGLAAQVFLRQPAFKLSQYS